LGKGERGSNEEKKKFNKEKKNPVLNFIPRRKNRGKGNENMKQAFSWTKARRRIETTTWQY